MAFIPTDISGCLLWLKADTDVNQSAGGAASGDGDVVGEWKDQSGSSHDATQGTADNKPIYRTNQINSLAGIDFDGSNDYLSITGLATHLTGADKPVSIFIVAKPHTVTPAQQNIFSLSSSSSNNPVYEIYAATNTYSIARRDDALSIKTAVSSASELAANGEYILTGIFTGKIVAGSVNASMTQCGNDMNVGTLTTDQAQLGVWSRLSGLLFPFDGVICEVIAYDSALSSSDAHSVLGYLASRYNLAVTTHLWTSNAASALTTPTHDGSGQCVHASVIKHTLSGYDYWMVMTPYPNANATYEIPNILASNNKTTWVVPEGLTNPIVTKPGGTTQGDPDLLFGQDNKLYCFYIQHDGATYWRVYVVSSDDGITWSAPTLVIDGTYMGPQSPSVIWDGSQYVMYYIDLGESPYVLKYRTSNSPTSGWSAANTCTITIPNGLNAWHVDVNKDRNTYQMFLNLSATGSGTNACLVYAFSSDGIAWTIDPIPLLMPPYSGWDNLRIYRSSAVLNGNNYDLWYSTYADGNVTHIGYTVAYGNAIASLAWGQIIG